MNNEQGTPNNEVNNALRNSLFNVRSLTFFKNYINLMTLGLGVNSKIFKKNRIKGESMNLSLFPQFSFFPFRIFFAILCSLSIIFIFGGCSKEISYKTLNFFFDGVPDTSAAPIKNDTLLQTNNTKKTDNLVLAVTETNRTVHPPYKNRKCKICHTDGGFTMPQPQLCYQCHEDFSSKYTFIHGPVAGGYCTACHHPHTGEKKLLLRKGQALCLYCHEKEIIFKNENHSGIDETNCTECHNPHGGQERYFFN